MKRLLFAATLLFVLSIGATHLHAKLLITRAGQRMMPANTMAAATLALSDDAETIQFDAVLSADNTVIAHSDPVLRSPQALRLFPDRVRPNKELLTTDLSYAEIRQLDAVYPPSSMDNSVEQRGAIVEFPIVRLSSLLKLVGVYEKINGKRISVVVELQKTWLHRDEGKDLSTGVIDLLAAFHASDPGRQLYIASYDAEELRRIHEQILPSLGITLGLIQLISDNDSFEMMSFDRDQWLPYNYDWMYSKFGLKAISVYADAIGILPSALTDADGTLVKRDYIEDAHLLGLKIFAYPKKPAETPWFETPAEAEPWVERYLFEAGLDGARLQSTAPVREYLTGRPQQDSPAESSASPIQQLLKQLEDTGPAENSPIQETN